MFGLLKVEIGQKPAWCRNYLIKLTFWSIKYPFPSVLSIFRMLVSNYLLTPKFFGFFFTLHWFMDVHELALNAFSHECVFAEMQRFLSVVELWVLFAGSQRWGSPTTGPTNATWVSTTGPPGRRWSWRQGTFFLPSCVSTATANLQEAEMCFLFLPPSFNVVLFNDKD